MSGVIIACCLRNLIKIHSVEITADMKTSLLQAMSLTVVNGEKELDFLRSVMKTTNAKLVTVFKWSFKILNC